MAAKLSDPVRRVKQDIFLAAYAKIGILKFAAEAADIHRSTHNYWLENDPEYATRHVDAAEDAADVVEMKLLQRGTVGCRQFKFHEGKPVMWKGKDGTDEERHYFEDKISDACLIVTAKARRPEKFRERHEVTGAAGGPLSVIHANIGLARLIHGKPELAQELRDLATAADDERDRTQPTPADMTDNGHVPAPGPA